MGKDNKLTRTQLYNIADNWVEEFFNSAKCEFAKNLESGAFLWAITPKDEHIARAQEVAQNNARIILNTFRDQDADTLEYIVKSYCAGLLGDFTHAAGAEEVKAALKVLKPLKALNIDKYGLYFGFLCRQEILANIRDKYNAQVIGETATIETKKAFINYDYTAGEFLALYTLYRVDKMRADVFAGIDKVDEFITKVLGLGLIANYCYYYTIARNALGLKRAELGDYAPTLKPIFPEEILPEYIIDAADAFCSERVKELKAEPNGKRFNDNDYIEIYGNILALTSRPIDRATKNDGRKLLERQPLAVYLERNRDQYPDVNNTTLQYAAFGINALKNAYPSVQPVNKQYTYKTTREEFAKLCGLYNTNSADRAALLNSLKLLQQIYVVVQRPEYKDDRGRICGGPTAVKLVNVLEIEIKNEGFMLQISEEAFNGRGHRAVLFSTLEKLLKTARGASGRRLLSQVLFKSHIKESDLLNQVFGYDDAIETAETLAGTVSPKASEEEYKAAQEKATQAKRKARLNVSKHKGANRQQLRAWLDAMQQTGAMRYTYNENDGIYSFEVEGSATAEEMALLNADQQ